MHAVLRARRGLDTPQRIDEFISRYRAASAERERHKRRPLQRSTEIQPSRTSPDTYRAKDLNPQRAPPCYIHADRPVALQLRLISVYENRIAVAHAVAARSGVQVTPPHARVASGYTGR